MIVSGTTTSAIGIARRGTISARTVETTIPSETASGRSTVVATTRTLAHRAARSSLERRSLRQCVEERAIALEGGALHVEGHAALAAELFAAAGAAWAAVDELGEGHARWERLAGDLRGAE